MRQSWAAVLNIFILLLAANASLRAETISFPKDDPIFKVEVPEGWAANDESGTGVILRPEGATTGHFFAFVELPPAEVHDAESAKKYLETYRVKDLDALGVDEKARTLWPVTEETLPNNLKSWSAGADAMMKTKQGDLPQMIAYTAIAFSPDGKKYFMMVAFGRSGDATANKEFLKKTIAAVK